MKKVFLLLLILDLLTLNKILAQDGKEWAEDIANFEKLDLKNLSGPENKKKDWIVFVGSSSLLMWNDLETCFPGKNIVNRGFGGSQISDLIIYSKRIINPYNPSQVVIYAGDNDLAEGKSSTRVFEDFKKLFGIIRNDLPKTKIIFISIKPSPSRIGLIKDQKKANKLIEDFIKNQKKASYIDVFNPMLDEHEKPMRKLFLEDTLHMNSVGYDLWKKIISPGLK